MWYLRDRNADRFVPISGYVKFPDPDTDVTLVLREYHSVAEKDLVLKRKIIEDQVGLIVSGFWLIRASPPGDAFVYKGCTQSTGAGDGIGVTESGSP